MDVHALDVTVDELAVAVAALAVTVAVLPKAVPLQIKVPAVARPRTRAGPDTIIPFALTECIPAHKKAR